MRDLSRNESRKRVNEKVKKRSTRIESSSHGLCPLQSLILVHIHWSETEGNDDNDDGNTDGDVKNYCSLFLIFPGMISLCSLFRKRYSPDTIFFLCKVFFRLYRLCWYYWLTGSETEVRQYKVANERRSKYPSADVLLSVLDVFPVCYEDDDDAEWNGSRMIHRKEKRPEGKLFLSFSATLLWVSDWRRILCSVKSFSSRLYCCENCMQMRILMQCMDKSWTTDTSHPPLPSSVSTFFESSSLFPALSLSLPLRWLYVSDSLDD